jgi:hypothetical protein
LHLLSRARQQAVSSALHKWSVLAVTLLFVLLMAACVRREGRNSDCTWPGEALRHLGQPATVWHLSADAEFAEDLADRYMISHDGPQSGHFVSFVVASEAEDRCLTKLFNEVGRIHGVTGRQVAGLLGHNLYWTDMGESLSFLLAYAFAASLATRRIWSRYPPADGWTEGILLLMFCSLAFAAGAVAVGENWVIIAESLRIGAGHLGERAQRSFFSHHRIQLFWISLVMFWLIAAASGWKARPVTGKTATV